MPRSVQRPPLTAEHAAPRAAAGTAARAGAAPGHAPLPVDPVPSELDLSRVPAHVACVMDGNGRWASRRDLPRTEGHAAGEAALLDVVNGALEIGVRWLTMYAFSTENWRRPADEVRYLMGFNESLLMRRRDELHRQGRADPLRRPPRLAGAAPGAPPDGRVHRAHPGQPTA